MTLAFGRASRSTLKTVSGNFSSDQNVLLMPGMHDIMFHNCVVQGNKWAIHTRGLFSSIGFYVWRVTEEILETVTSNKGDFFFFFFRFILTSTWLTPYLLSQQAVWAIFSFVCVILCSSVLWLYGIMVCAVSVGCPCPWSYHKGSRTGSSAALALQAWVQTHPLHSAVNTTNSWWHTS